MPDWVNAGYNEYAKRLSGNISLNLIEIAPIKRTKTSNTDNIKEQEAEKILASLKKTSAGFTIALDERGAQWDTKQLAQNLQKWQIEHRNIGVLVGGPDGLAPQCLHAANVTCSLSKLTFPHQLVRIIFAEQIYRAWSILNKHPYHRE
jgi:23S rRNA (pseudouridine1915-N3)-methyltransferase